MHFVLYKYFPCTVDEAVNNVDVAIAGLKSIYSAVDSATGTVSGVEVGNINATYGALQDDYKQVGQGAASGTKK